MASNKKQNDLMDSLEEKLEKASITASFLEKTFDDFLKDPTQYGQLTIEQADKILEGAFLFSKWVCDYEQEARITALWVKWKKKYSELIED